MVFSHASDNDAYTFTAVHLLSVQTQGRHCTCVVFEVSAVGRGQRITVNFYAHHSVTHTRSSLNLPYTAAGLSCSQQTRHCAVWQVVRTAAEAPRP
jgi:hypothetical protein